MENKERKYVKIKRENHSHAESVDGKRVMYDTTLWIRMEMKRITTHREHSYHSVALITNSRSFTLSIAWRTSCLACVYTFYTPNNIKLREDMSYVPAWLRACMYVCVWQAKIEKDVKRNENLVVKTFFSFTTTVSQFSNFNETRLNVELVRSERECLCVCVMILSLHEIQSTQNQQQQQKKTRQHNTTQQQKRKEEKYIDKNPHHFIFLFAFSVCVLFFAFDFILFWWFLFFLVVSFFSWWPSHFWILCECDFYEITQWICLNYCLSDNKTWENKWIVWIESRVRLNWIALDSNLEFIIV